MCFKVFQRTSVLILDDDAFGCFKVRCICMKGLHDWMRMFLGIFKVKLFQDILGQVRLFQGALEVR